MDLPDDILKSNAERDAMKIPVDELLNQIRSKQSPMKQQALPSRSKWNVGSKKDEEEGVNKPKIFLDDTIQDS